jgi:Leucine-rich repeat (LRR) protein
MNLDTDSAASPNSYSEMYQDRDEESGEEEDMYGYMVPYLKNQDPHPDDEVARNSQSVTSNLSTTGASSLPFDEQSHSVASRMSHYFEDQDGTTAHSSVKSLQYDDDTSIANESVEISYINDGDDHDNESVQLSLHHSLATMSYEATHSVMSLQYDDAVSTNASVGLSYTTNEDSIAMVYIPSPFAAAAEEESHPPVQQQQQQEYPPDHLPQYVYDSSNSSTDPPSSVDDLEFQPYHHHHHHHHHHHNNNNNNNNMTGISLPNRTTTTTNGRKHKDASVASSSSKKNKKHRTVPLNKNHEPTKQHRKDDKQENKRGGRMSCCKKCLLISVPTFILLLVGGGFVAYRMDFWGLFGEDDNNNDGLQQQQQQQQQQQDEGNFWAPSTPISERPLETPPPTAAPTVTTTFLPTMPPESTNLMPSTPTDPSAMDYRRAMQAYFEGIGISFFENTTNVKALNRLVVDVQAAEPEESGEGNFFVKDTHRTTQRFALYCLGLSLETPDSTTTTSTADLIFQRLQIESLSQNHCHWPGVSCTTGEDESQPQITSISLNNQVLDGTIPSEIALLSSLTSLDLSKNNLHGSIPSELFHVSTLEKVYLYHNQLRGKLSDMIDQSSITHLHLSHNKLSGSIPEFNSGLRK